MSNITQLFKQGDRVFIEVEYKGFTIQKWLDPSEPGHDEEIKLLTSDDTKAIQAYADALETELQTALSQPEVGILDLHGDILEPIIPPEKISLLPESPND